MLFQESMQVVGVEREDFVLRVSLDADSYVLEVYGDLDMRTADLMSSKIQECQNGGDGVVVDLSGLDLITSAGMDALVVADARAERDDAPLVLLRGPDHVHRTFARAGLVGRLPFDD